MENWENKMSESLKLEHENVSYSETWRDVVGFEGYYIVSSFGRVKGVDREVPNGWGGNKKMKGRFMALGLGTNGYVCVRLWKGNKETQARVHRLVAVAFIGNPNNLPEVNHKNGSKVDNFLKNLDWSTASQNQLHSFKFLGKKTKPMYGTDNGNSKRIKCDTLDMVFNTVNDAALTFGFTQPEISMVLTNKRKHIQGMVFKYL